MTLASSVMDLLAACHTRQTFSYMIHLTASGALLTLRRLGEWRD
jgi:hypothetical protein